MEVQVADAAAAEVNPTYRPPTGDLLRVRDLTIRFSHEGRELTAVERVSFNIAAGEIVGMLGESGCGKTTLGLSLLGILPDSGRISNGSIFFGRHDLRSLNESELREIRGAQLAIIYQDSSILNPVLRVGKQVSDVLRAHRKCTARQAREEVQTVFAEIGLKDFDRIYNAYPHQLSGGQRQRIAIAQALICRPSLVIADEPTASVDRNTACEILDCVTRMKESYGTSFLFISHDPATLAAIADRIIVMYAGEIVEAGSLRDVYSQPLHPYTEALLQCAPPRSVPGHSDYVKGRLPFIPGKAPDPLEISRGCCFSSRCQYRMDSCDSRKPQHTQISPQRSVCCFKREVG